MEDYLEKIMEYRLKGYCCSQILLQLGLHEKGSENPEMIDAVKGLCGGLHSGLLCGALSGGACLLSLLNPGEAHKEMIPALTEWFLKQYASYDCRAILESNPVSPYGRCADIVICTYEKVLELLYENA